MKKNVLGRTGIEVSELCFGALPMGPLQKNLSIDVSTQLVISALKGGVNFIDTAQFYRTYEPIKIAIRSLGKKPVIATKSMASTYEDMQNAVDEALHSMDVPAVDIFHLHSPRSGPEVFKERAGAFQCLLDNKKKGIIKAVGVSTHSVSLTSHCADIPEIDVVFPIINFKGLGIIGGSAEDMNAAITRCSNSGKGIYLMKVLGGGSLIEDYFQAFEFIKTVSGWSSVALGMVSLEEVSFNLEYFHSGWKKPQAELPKSSKTFHVVPFICKNCGICINMCPNQAIESFDGKARINPDKCVRCGYCAGDCPQFAIRMI